MSDEMHILYQRKSGLVATEIDGETVMMSVEQGTYFGLDAIAGEIWKMLERPTSIAELCGQLLEEFDVTEEACYCDVRDLIDNLLANQLVELVGI